MSWTFQGKPEKMTNTWWPIGKQGIAKRSAAVVFLQACAAAVFFLPDHRNEVLKLFSVKLQLLLNIIFVLLFKQTKGCGNGDKHLDQLKPMLTALKLVWLTAGCSVYCVCAGIPFCGAGCGFRDGKDMDVNFHVPKCAWNRTKSVWLLAVRCCQLRCI